MKRILIFILITAVAAMAAINESQLQSSGQRISPTTVQRRSIQLASVTADAADPNAAEMNWADAKTLCQAIPAEWSYVSLGFYGYGDGDGVGDPNDTTFSYDIYLVDLYGGFEAIATGNTGTIGAQQLSHDPCTGAELNSGEPDSNYCWADDLNQGTVSSSSARLSYSDYESTNGRAKVRLDRESAVGVYVRIYNMTSQAVTSVTCVMNGYNN